MMALKARNIPVKVIEHYRDLPRKSILERVRGVGFQNCAGVEARVT